MTTQPARAFSRVAAIDLLRGWVMVLMVVDHLREFFFLHAQVMDPVDLAVTSPALALRVSFGLQGYVAASLI